MNKVNHKQGICPICGNENLEYGSMEIGDESVSYPWTCDECGSNGYEVYNLQFVEHDKVCVNSKKTGNRKQKKNEILDFFCACIIFIIIFVILFIFITTSLLQQIM